MTHLEFSNPNNCHSPDENPIYSLYFFNFPASPKAGVSPQPSKLAKPLTTLREEREAKPLLDGGDDVRELFNYSYLDTSFL